MRTLTTFLIVSAICFLSNANSIEPEPNWQNRLLELKKAEVAKFKTPKVGDTITVERRIGPSITGKITAIGQDSVTLDGRKPLLASQLTSDTCDRIFPEMYAARVAAETLKDEQENYNIRKQGEINQQKADTEKLEAQRKASEAAAKVEVEEQRRLVLEKDKLEAERSREAASKVSAERAGQVAAGFGTFMIVACIVGFFFYIVPSVIAFARGHHNAGAICAVNILFGWSVIGWIISLIWALTSSASPTVHITVNTSASTPSSSDTQGRKIIIRKRGES